MELWATAYIGDFTPLLSWEWGISPSPWTVIPQMKALHVKNKHLPIYNYQLIACTYQNYEYEINIPTPDWRGIGGIDTS